MKLRTLISTSAAALALSFSTVCYAQDAAPAPEAATAEKAPGNPAMWEVKDEDTTIYLFGTVHMLPDTVDWFSGPVKAAVDSSDTLVTEINMTPEATATMGGLVQSKGMLPQGQTLRGLMTDEQRAVYEAGLAKVNIPAAAFDAMEPWLASIALLQITTQASGFNPELGAETVLEKIIPEGTERVALETVEFQISVFDELPIEQQILFLLEGAADPVAAIQQLNQIVDVWAQGKPEELGAMMNDALVEHPNLAERLLYMRNANWADWIDERMDTPGTVFVAVGAGHLAGTKTVQDYLAEKGITATRVQ